MINPRVSNSIGKNNTPSPMNVPSLGVLKRRSNENNTNIITNNEMFTRFQLPNTNTYERFIQLSTYIVK